MARDAGDRVAHALCAAAAAQGVTVTIDAVRSKRWASATFTGGRHNLRMRADDTPALVAWLSGVAEHEFTIRGQLVADLALESVERADRSAVIRFAALTVEDQ